MSWRRRHQFPAYVSVAERKSKAQRLIRRMRKKGAALEPVDISGRKITHTFWGRSWERNMESYADYANRLPRGRSYVRHGSVIDLRISAGTVTAQVSGTSLYRVKITIEPVPDARWQALTRRCADGIDSMVELLQGKLSAGVMEVICDRKHGLFPSPAEITFSCSCPDRAAMCKHVAATMYGVGARLDTQPALLFQLRGVDAADLIHTTSLPLSAPADDLGDLGDLFGIELDLDAPPPAPAEPTLPQHIAEALLALLRGEPIPQAAHAALADVPPYTLAPILKRLREHITSGSDPLEVLTAAARKASAAAEGAALAPVPPGPLQEELALFFSDAIALDFEEIDHTFLQTPTRAVWCVDWVDWLKGAPATTQSIAMVDDGQRRFFLTSFTTAAQLDAALGSAGPDSLSALAALADEMLMAEPSSTARLGYRKKRARRDAGYLRKVLGI